MPTVDRDRARAAFEAYVGPYDIANLRIALKVAHTYRVAAIAERIAAAEGWTAEDIDLAWLCGLLHDIGRFEQLRLWDTFRDAGSASHAALGEAVLAERSGRRARERPRPRGSGAGAPSGVPVSGLWARCARSRTLPPMMPSSSRRWRSTARFASKAGLDGRTVALLTLSAMRTRSTSCG